MALPAFPPFDVYKDGNVGPRWSKWLTRLERLLTGMAITDPDRKRALLVHYGGPDLDDIFDTLTVRPVTENEPQTLYTHAVQALTDYFTPKTNIAFEVYNFRQARQQPGESIDAFSTRLCQLAKSCSFDNEDREIANQIIFACQSQALRRRALREDMPLQDLVSAARSLEISECQAMAVEHSHDTASAHSIQHGRGRQHLSRGMSHSASRNLTPHRRRRVSDNTCNMPGPSRSAKRQPPDSSSHVIIVVEIYLTPGVQLGEKFVVHVER